MICRKRRQSMSRTGLSATRPGVIIRSEHVSRQVGREPGSPPWKFPAWCRGWSGNATTRLIREPRSVSRNPFPPCRPAAVQRAIRQPRHARRARHLAHPGAPLRRYPDRNRHTALHRPDERHPPGRQPDQPQYLLGHRAAPAHRAGRAPQPGRPSADPAVRRGRHPGRLWQNPVDIRAGSIGLLDLGQTLDTRTTLISTITLTVPRDRLPTALRSRKLHGTLLIPDRALRACWPRICRSWRSTPPA